MNRRIMVYFRWLVCGDSDVADMYLYLVEAGSSMYNY